MQKICGIYFFWELSIISIFCSSIQTTSCIIHQVNQLGVCLSNQGTRAAVDSIRLLHDKVKTWVRCIEDVHVQYSRPWFMFPVSANDLYPYCCCQDFTHLHCTIRPFTVTCTLYNFTFYSHTHIGTLHSLHQILHLCFGCKNSHHIMLPHTNICNILHKQVAW